MSQMQNRAVLMSGHELLLLLFKREAEGLILPQEISELGGSEAELKAAMGDLITDKYLLPGENGLYRIAPDISEMLEIMTGASNTLVLEELQHKFEPCYLYRRNLEAVLLNMDVHHEGWIRLETVRLEDKIKELTEFPLAKIQVRRFKMGDSEPDKVIMITDGVPLEETLDKLLEV